MARALARRRCASGFAGAASACMRARSFFDAMSMTLSRLSGAAGSRSIAVYPKVNPGSSATMARGSLRLLTFASSGSCLCRSGLPVNDNAGTNKVDIVGNGRDIARGGAVAIGHGWGCTPERRLCVGDAVAHLVFQHRKARLDQLGTDVP